MIRPEVRQACGVLRELNALHDSGRMTTRKWFVDTVGVLARIEACFSPSLEERALFAATAAPRVANTSDQDAAENVAVLGHRDPSNRPSVQGHAA